MVLSTDPALERLSLEMMEMADGDDRYGNARKVPAMTDWSG
jgi:hypothetical protein